MDKQKRLQADGMRLRTLLLCTAAHNFTNSLKISNSAERGWALLTKLPNFTSPGPEFLPCIFGASGVPLKGVRLMRSLKRHRQYHSFHLKNSNLVLSSLITSQQRKRTRWINSQTSPPTHFSCFNVYVFVNTFI